MSDLPILILAAGQSSRMRGRDKLLEEVEGQPLLRRQAGMARQVTTGPVLVALPVAPHPRYAALEGLDVVTVPVPDAGEGMGASLRTGFAALPRVRAAMLLLADLPDLTGADLTRMLDAAQTGGDTLAWRATTADGRPGHPVIFAAPLFDAIAQLRGDAGARAVLAAAGDQVRHIALPGQRARVDLDTPEDWAAWRARR